MRLRIYLPFLLLYLILGACSRDRLEIEYIPVKTEDGDRMTLMSPDGKTVDYDFRGDVSYVVNGVFTVRDRRGFTVYRFDRKEPEAVENLENLYWAGFMSEGLIPFRRKDGGRLEFADADGDVRFSLGKDVSGSRFFSDGLMVVSSVDRDNYATRYGAVNTSGDIVVKMRYDRLLAFSEGCAPALNGEKWMLIDKNGVKIADLKGVDNVIAPMAGGYVAVCRGDQWGFCDRNGEFRRLKNDLSIVNFNGRYAVVEDSGTDSMGVYDVDGNQVVPLRYETVFFCGRDRFICRKGDDRWLIFDSDGEKVAEVRAEILFDLDGAGTQIGGNFLIGGESGCYYLYDRDGHKISDSRFRELG